MLRASGIELNVAIAVRILHVLPPVTVEHAERNHKTLIGRVGTHHKTILFGILALFCCAATAQTADAQMDLVLHFSHTAGDKDLQQITSVVRDITEIRQASLDRDARTLALQGSASQIALAGWLFGQLDQAPGAQPGAARSATYQSAASSGDDDLVRVFFLASTQTDQDLAAMSTVVRSTTDIRRTFICSAPRAITMRGTASQIALAAWLFNKLDRPADKPVANDADLEPYRAADGDDLARVLYLPQTETPQGAEEMIRVVRRSTSIPRGFAYNPLRALVLRGTAGQIATAERLVQQHSKL